MGHHNKSTGTAGIPKIFAPYFVEAAARLGIPSDALIERLPFEFSWCPGECERLYYGEFNALIEALLALSPISSPGLSFSRFPMIERVEETIIEAQPLLARPRDLLRPAELMLSQTLAPLLRLQTRPESGGEALDFDWQRQLFSTAVNDFIAEMLMTRCVELLRTLTPARAEIRSVQLRRTAPDDSAIYRRVFQCPVQFSCAGDALVLGPETLDAPIPRYHRLLRSQSRNTLKAVLHDTLSNCNLAASLRHWLERRLLHEEVTIGRAAAHFGIGERTLQRRLRAQGVTFQQIKDGATLALTKQLLLSTSDSVESIATRLHYAERSVFAKFFKKREGVSPSEYRRSNTGAEAI
ncbi:helix-turn-helix domain-containing protein [Microbulbifer taiwanensis]|uniref:Helix-turn-helix domain-containing protein n=1 Tax=Microbulbifer taiwanensis TaxID=986746 RepID=A0ABW1YPN5_9GAMM|nr:AraC family transcriptional regulator [Microbulbifer taiwanensis]